MQALTSAMSVACEDDVVVYSPRPIGSWWKAFEDPQLSFFIETAFERNPTLQEAYANILLAEARADCVRAGLFPNIIWGADSSRQKLSETGLIPFNQLPVGVAGPAPAQIAVVPDAGGIPVYFSQRETEFNLSYDFDLWGKNRNTWSSALGEVQARIADEAFARLELGIAVARVYFQLQIDYQRLKVAERLVELKHRYSELVQGRVASGLDSVLTLQASLANLSSTKLSLLEVQGDIAVNENKLRAYLTGQFNEDISTYPIGEKPLPKVSVPADLPLRLIAYRPDIIAQLWMIESAGKQIEVAQAGFYPDVNINAFFGFQTIHLHKWFEWPSVFFNADPAISLPLFDGGRLEANLQGSQVNYRLAIYQYNQKILDAVKETLDGLALVSNTHKQLLEYDDQLEDQREIVRLTRLRVENNIDSELDALVSETQLLGVEELNLVVLGHTLQATLSLIKAVGGGYEAGVSCFCQEEGG